MSQADHKTSKGYPAAIVWDLDGTLVESAPDLANALNIVLNESGQHSHTVDKVRTMIGAETISSRVENRISVRRFMIAFPLETLNPPEKMIQDGSRDSTVIFPAARSKKVVASSISNPAGRAGVIEVLSRLLPMMFGKFGVII